LGTLVEAGVIKDEDAHQKRLIKINTGLVYKQQKYNILREEPEGYAKLVTVLSRLPRNGKNMESIIGNIQSIIGQFDLDPNRVMDIILDCFEQEPDNSSFLEILKVFRIPNLVHILGFKLLFYHSKVASSVTGTPASLYLLVAAAIMADLVSISELLPYLEPTIETTLEMLRVEEDKFKASLVSVGNPVLGSSLAVTPKEFQEKQFLTKEFRMRQGSSASSSSVPVAAEVSPDTKPSAPSLPLPPTITSSSSSAALHSAKPPPPSGPPPKQTQTSSTNNKSDNTNKNNAETTTQEREKTVFPLFSSSANPTNTNQVLGVINGLIRCRGWTEAEQLMTNLFFSRGISRDFFLIHCPEIRHSIQQLLSFSIERLYYEHCVSTIRTGSFHKKRMTSSSSSVSSSSSSILSITPSSFHSSPSASHSLYQEIVSIENFPLMSEELVEWLSYHISEDNQLFVKLCQLLKKYLEIHYNKSGGNTNDSGSSLVNQEKELAPLTDELKKAATVTLALLHGLSVSGAEATYFSSQLWAAISLWPFSWRFTLYDSWLKTSGGASSGCTTSAPSITPLYGLSLAAKNAFQSTRREMKRLAKETTKQVGKNIAKFVQGNPGEVIRHILNQIESFDNLIPVIIEALRYSLDLSRDVFAACILAHLKRFSSSPDSKLKEAGASTHYAGWFLSLSKFIGTFYCRFPGTELKGLIAYLLDSLGQGGQGGQGSADLLILKDLLGIMGGSDTLTNVSPSQLEGLSGGKTLRGEVMGNSASIKSGLATLSTRKSSVILREELLSSGAALPLLLFLAQLRNSLLFDSETRNTHLKLIAHLFDTAQDLLIQFTEFLVAEAKSLEFIAQLMPSVEELIGEIGLAVPVVFQLTRPLVRAALQASLVNGNGNNNTSLSAPSAGPLDDLNNSDHDNNEKVDFTSVPAYLRPWHPFSKEFRAKVVWLMNSTDPRNNSSIDNNETNERETVPPSELFSPDLFVLFWSLSLYDISVPVDRYQSENRRIKDRFTELDNKKDSSASALNMNSSEYSRYMKNKDNEMKSLMISMTSLQEELNQQKRHVEGMREILTKRQESFFSFDFSEGEDLNGSSGDNAVVPSPMDYFLQSLVFRRILMSPLDSVFCTKFARVLHETIVTANPATANSFSLVSFYQKSFEYLLPLVFSSTECEAAFIGYALVEVLAVICRWQSSASLFALEAVNKKQNIFGGHDSQPEQDDKDNVKDPFQRFLELCKVSQSIKQCFRSSPFSLTDPVLPLFSSNSNASRGIR
jgi:hypothetical protein